MITARVAKVMFSQASVILSTLGVGVTCRGGGGGGTPPPPGQTSVRILLGCIIVILSYHPRLPKTMITSDLYHELDLDLAWFPLFRAD